jgi:hypothetical protein
MRALIGLLIAASAVLFQSATSGEADEVLAQLSKIRLDKKQIYTIRDVTLRRDVLSIAFNRGTIAFLEPVKGKVTGAVFIGSGEIVAIPPDAVEKQQIFKFTNTPILNEPFQTALLRFTDNTFEDLKREIAEHAQEDPSPEDIAQFAPWDAALATRSASLNIRILTDLLESQNTPFFLAELNGERTGWFNTVFDLRSTEEVSIFQLRDTAAGFLGDVWASFNQRSEARNLEAVAHEYKSPVDILSYDIDGTTGPDKKIDAKVIMRIKARTVGARVLTFDLAPALRIASISADKDEAVPFYQFPNASNFSVVLERVLKSGEELTLKINYSGNADGDNFWYPSQQQQTLPVFHSSLSLPAHMPGRFIEFAGRTVAPSNYHDYWLMEGLTRYLAAFSQDANDSAGTRVRALLNEMREQLKPVETAGPIWIGPRIISSRNPEAYRAVYGKGVWIIHMLRMMLRQEGQNPDAKFLEMLNEFMATYDGKAVSTWDFRRVAEKYAAKKLDWFFDQWVLDAGLPTYSVDYKIDGGGSQYTIRGTITQTGVPDGFMMPVPVYADNEYLGTVQVGESDGQFRFQVSKKPERVLIDPEMTVLTATAQ